MATGIPTLPHPGTGALRSRVKHAYNCCRSNLEVAPPDGTAHFLYARRFLSDSQSGILIVIVGRMCQARGVKLFYTGPVVNAEMLVVMLEKHGIIAAQEFVEAEAPDDGDLSRPAKVLVPEADFERAHRLFYTEREDEL